MCYLYFTAGETGQRAGVTHPGLTSHQVVESGPEPRSAASKGHVLPPLPVSEMGGLGVGSRLNVHEFPPGLECLLSSFTRMRMVIMKSGGRLTLPF